MPITAITCLLGTASLIGLHIHQVSFQYNSRPHTSTIFGADVSYLFNIGLFMLCTV